MSAIECDPNSYQHVDRLRVLISELSGRQNILGKMRMLDLFGDDGGGGGGGGGKGGWGLDDAVLNERALVILDRVKRLESMGYTFEGPTRASS